MNGLTYCCLDSGDLPELIEFVVRENYARHAPICCSKLDDQIAQVTAEERTLGQGAIFVARDGSGNIVASIRVLKWDGRAVLPLERLFGINPRDFLPTAETSAWHIGRFAVKQGIGGAVFKTLMTCAVSRVCSSAEAVAFAECDAKLLRVLPALGMGYSLLAEPRLYLGSYTAPVQMTYSDLLEFTRLNLRFLSVGL